MRGIFLRGFILLPIIVVQGCALPVPVQVASWLIDGISYLATEKSVADHGVSLVAQKDCAMWRGLKGEAFCREDTEGVYALWDTGASGNSGDLAEDAAPALREPEGAPEDLAAFETAAGAPDREKGVAGTAPSTPVTAVAASATPSAAPSGSRAAAEPERPVAALPETETSEAASGVPVPEIPVAAVPEPVTPVASAPVLSLARFFGTFVSPADPPVTQQSAGDDMYYVIGSFRRIIEAERLADRHFTLEPAVIVAIQDGRRVFRVVVGPYTPADEEPLRRAISRIGIANAWAMRFDPMEWELSPLRARDVAELS